MPTTMPFVKRTIDVRACAYVEEMNDAVRRCHERGEAVLAGIVDGNPGRELGSDDRGLEYPAFVLLDEQPEGGLEYPAVCEAPSSPSVATFEEQLQDLAARRRLAEAA